MSINILGLTIGKEKGLRVVVEDEGQELCNLFIDRPVIVGLNFPDGEKRVEIDPTQPLIRDVSGQQQITFGQVKADAGLTVHHVEAQPVFNTTSHLVPELIHDGLTTIGLLDSEMVEGVTTLEISDSPCVIVYPDSRLAIHLDLYF